MSKIEKLATKAIQLLEKSQNSCRELENIFESGEGDLVVYEIIKRSQRDQVLRSLLKNHSCVSYDIWQNIYEKINENKRKEVEQERIMGLHALSGKFGTDKQITF